MSTSSPTPSLHISKFRRWLLQSPPAEWALNHVRELLIGALRQGPIPRHVAFVMDGNRRFARNHKIETVEGHNLGFEALARILEVCYKAGVEVVTIYAFSIENFKRSKYEVDALMDMAKIKLSQMSQHGELLDRYGAKIQILGQKELVRLDVLEAINHAVDLTKHNDRAVLNVCFPYTSRDEITTAIRSTVADFSQPLEPLHSSSKRPFSESSITRNIRSRALNALPDVPEVSEDSSSDSSSYAQRLSNHGNDLRKRAGSPVSSASSSLADSATSAIFSSSSAHPHVSPDSSYPHSPDDPLDSHSPNANHTKPHSSHGPTAFPDPEDITARTLTQHMYTAGSPPLDLLIRTSGVQRLSDFMLWQCHEHTSIVFLKCLWPEFDLWQFLPVLVEWQWWRGRGMGEREGEASVGMGLGRGTGAKDRRGGWGLW